MERIIKILLVITAAGLATVTIMGALVTVYAVFNWIAG